MYFRKVSIYGKDTFLAKYHTGVCNFTKNEVPTYDVQGFGPQVQRSCEVKDVSALDVLKVPGHKNKRT